MKIEILLPSVAEFYQETDVVESPDKSAWDMHKTDDSSHFNGLPLKEILKCKYSYTEGLDKLEELEGDIDVGGTTRKYIWNDFDGDDMSYDRYIEGLPCMSKRIRTHGIGTGRIVTVHVNISEFGSTSYKQMLNKAYTAIQLIDFLENLGYRVGVNVYDGTANLGSKVDKDGNRKYLDYVQIEIPLKTPEEPLNKALILTCISPWFERYWIFKYHKAKFKCNFGMGRAADMNGEDTKTDIYIKQGQCLSEQSSLNRIEEIKELFKVK